MSAAKNNLVLILSGLLRGLNIPVSSFTIRKTLLNHPDYPSLFAVSDCLKAWNVPHDTFIADKYDLDVNEITYPFIANLSFPKKGNLVLVQSIDNGKVKYLDSSNNSIILEQSEFQKKWDGIVLLAQKGEFSGEKNYKKSVVDGIIHKSKFPLLIVTLIMCVMSVIVSQHFDNKLMILAGLKISGIAIGILLLIHSFDSNNSYLKALCNISAKNNCDSILSSDSSKINSWLSWSEVGFLYFAGSCISLLVFPSSIMYLKWLNLLCLPYTFYSIIYQLIKKSWCVLCCSVQLLLWLEAVTFNMGKLHFLKYDTSGITLPGACLFLLPFLIISSIWMFIKPELQIISEVPLLKKHLGKFKSDNDLFTQLLTKQPKYEFPESLRPLVLGNKTAKTIITVVSGAFCGACGRAHEQIDEWIKNDDNIQVQIFFAHPNRENDLRSMVAKHMSALVLTGDTQLVENSVRDWYGIMKTKYAKLIDKYPAIISDETSEITFRQYEWCKRLNITKTPTYFINGHILMEHYDLADIKYLLN